MCLWHVMLVDDEPRQRRGMEELVRELLPGAEVSAHRDGQRALEYASDHPVDIVFSDIRMPRMSGLELAGELRAARPEALVVLISAYADFDYAQQGIELGVFGYLLKPIEAGAVDRMLKKAAERLSERDAGSVRDDARQTAYVQHMLNSWLRGEMSDADEGRLRALLPGGGAVGLALVALCEDDMVSKAERSETMANLAYWWQEAMLPVRAIACRLEGRSDALVCVMNVAEIDGSALRARMDTFIRRMTAEYGVQLSAILDDRPISLNASSEAAERLEALLESLSAARAPEARLPIQRALHFIHQHYRDDLSLARVAAICHYNPSYFSSLFKAETGESFVSYVNRFRLEHAVDLIQRTARSLGSIADEVGFADYKYFTRLFQRRYGMSPQQYRSKGAQ